MKLTDGHINQSFTLVPCYTVAKSLSITYLGRERDNLVLSKQCHLFGFNDFFDEEELIKFAEIEPHRVWCLDHLVRYQKQNVIDAKHLKPGKQKLFIWLEESELEYLAPLNQLQEIVVEINNELNYDKEKI